MVPAWRKFAIVWSVSLGRPSRRRRLLPRRLAFVLMRSRSSRLLRLAGRLPVPVLGASLARRIVLLLFFLLSFLAPPLGLVLQRLRITHPVPIAPPVLITLLALMSPLVLIALLRPPPPLPCRSTWLRAANLPATGAGGWSVTLLLLCRRGRLLPLLPASLVRLRGMRTIGWPMAITPFVERGVAVMSRWRWC